MLGQQLWVQLNSTLVKTGSDSESEALEHKEATSPSDRPPGLENRTVVSGPRCPGPSRASPGGGFWASCADSPQTGFQGLSTSLGIFLKFLRLHL